MPSKFRIKILCKLHDERGSLSILSTSLFFLLVISSFVILNTSSAFIAKRELIQIGETAITRATHNLDVSSYYSGTSNGNASQNFSGSAIGNANGGGTGGSGIDAALPINCTAAYQTFTQQLSLENLRSKPIGFSEWNCDGFATSAKVTSQAEHLLRIPFITGNSTFTLSATISAHNRLY